MVDGAIGGLGHLDVVVNNAGGTAFMVPFTQLRFAGWEKVMRLNVESVVHVLQAVAPHLLDRGRGSVVNVASVAGLGATPALTPYGASKAALISLTRSLAVEWASAGVRVNALCPGWTATELNRNLWEDERASAGLTATIPMGRWGRAEEMAGPAVFLASDASSFMTGQVLVVDGGQTAT
jgi:NAD(P)-dependent dehydrogenase (short-subunit alcohol dehydrogenase family)